MAEELQSFLNRIQEEGIKSGEEEARRIIADAESKAELIVKRARVESEEIIHRAEKEADNLLRHGKEALKLAARDTLLSLRHELQSRMQALFRQLTGEALSADSIAEIVADIIKKYLETGSERLQIEVLLTPQQCDALEGALQEKLAENLLQEVTVSPVPEIGGGFQLRQEGQNILYDFTDEALAETLNTFLSPKIVTLLKG